MTPPPRAVSFFGCSPIGVVRRLQGLTAQGYSDEWTIKQLGWDSRQLRDVHTGERQVDDIAAHDLHVLCASVGDRCPIWGRVRAEAAAQDGWAPLTAWLPGEIDDPQSRSDLHYRRTSDDDLPRRTEVTEVHWLRAAGADTEEIARRLGLKPESVERAEQRAAQRERRRACYADEQLLDALVRVLTGERQLDVARDTTISRSHLCNILAGRDRVDLLEPARQIANGLARPERPAAITPQPPTTTNAPLRRTA